MRRTRRLDDERRRLAAAGTLAEAAPRFDRPARSVAGGGVLAALPALLREGLLEPARRMLRLPDGYYGLSAVLLTCAFLTLSRARAPEALRHQAPGEWGLPLGLDRCPEVKTLRQKTALIADAEETVHAWQSALARAWMEDERDDWMTLAVDGHVKVYHGRKGRLPKGFVSRQKLCLPASASYWVNVLGGKPLLCLHKKLDPKLTRALEEDVLPELERMGRVPADAPDLRQGGRPVATLVFDREGWSPQLFARLARRGVACVTWRKGSREDDWPRAEFRSRAVPVHGPVGRGGSLTVSLAERRVELRDGLQVREIRRLLESGRQAALITTHPDMPTEEVAGAMFSRWSQENFFKYMREEFRLDALPEHAVEPLDPETRVVNPERREARKEVERIKRRLQSVETRVRGKRAKGMDATGLEAEARALRKRLEEETLRRDRLPAHVRAGELRELSL